MKYLALIFSICMSLVLVSGQFFGPHFDTFGGFNSYGLRSLTPDFGEPSAFAGSLRDPRQNRGPVVFPPAPADAPVESSGVIVGASGYGFVPPQNHYSQYGFDSVPNVPSISNISPYSKFFSPLNYF